MIATDMQIAIEEACSKLFLKKSFIEQRPDVLGSVEGVKLGISGRPMKRVENYESLTWPRTKEPQKPKPLSSLEDDIHRIYLRISKEPEHAF